MEYCATLKREKMFPQDKINEPGRHYTKWNKPIKYFKYYMISTIKGF